jgi:hypothetical protein
MKTSVFWLKKIKKQMSIHTFSPREPLFVPSNKCQSLLGKAIQEHFTKIDQIASVFSSSPSLQNSSAGANFLTNFRIDGESILLFRSVFTPEDCFSLQFTFSIRIVANTCNQSTFDFIFNFIRQLVNKKPKYLEASLLSLKIDSPFITNEQLIFILSNLKRITNLELELLDSAVTSGVRSIENLTELEKLKIVFCRGITTPVLELFASRLQKLHTLVFRECDGVDDEGILAISTMKSITCLTLLNSSRQISSFGFTHLAAMTNLRDLTIHGQSNFKNENLEEICCNCRLLKKLHLTGCLSLISEGTTQLASLTNLVSLFLNRSNICDESIDHISSLTELEELNVGNTKVSDLGVQKISSSLQKLKILTLTCNALITDKSLEHLAKCISLQQLDVTGISISTRATYSFLQTTKPRLKEFYGSGLSACVFEVFADPPAILDWTVETICDQDVSFLIDILGDDGCLKIQEINLSRTPISETSLILIAEKCTLLTTINLRKCEKISSSVIEKFKIRLPNCEVLF